MEVDLGMEYVHIFPDRDFQAETLNSARLRNIEDTEKAKLALTEGKKERRNVHGNDEEHLVSTRCQYLGLLLRFAS